MTRRDIVIEIVDVSKKYNNNSKFALKNINITIQDGEIVGLFGLNGAGKTTLLKSIMNLIKPTSGEILVDNKIVNYKSYNDIAFITEECSMFSNLNVDEHRDFFSTSFEKFDTSRFEDLVNFFKLDRNKKLSEFSKGQKSKLEISVGFSKRAKHILMDEPFSGNDIFTRTDFLKLMAGFIEADSVILIATHLISEIENFITRAIFIDDGHICGDYQMEELAEQNLHLLDKAKELFGYDENRIMEFIK